MIKPRRYIILVYIIITSGIAFTWKQRKEVRNDFKPFYDQHNVEGSFVLYDPIKDKYIFYNQAQFKQQFSPASTFKICNSLIGLETGVIKDENFIIAWDSVPRSFYKWNQDHDLKSAFKNSTVWYYQELARRVGGKRMKYWLDKVQYGNTDTTGGIDQFWLTGGLRITPEEQINFLRKLREESLPFSRRSMNIVKKIMITNDSLDYVVRAKTGWSDEEKRMVGWYVGYIEQGNRVYYFVNCIQTQDLNHSGFAQARIDITNNILTELKLIK